MSHLDAVHKLALDYLAFEGHAMLALTILDTVMRQASDMPLREIRQLCRALEVPERPGFAPTNTFEETTRLGDLRRFLAGRRKARCGA